MRRTTLCKRTAIGEERGKLPGESRLAVGHRLARGSLASLAVVLALTRARSRVLVIAVVAAARARLRWRGNKVRRQRNRLGRAAPAVHASGRSGELSSRRHLPTSKN